MPKNHWGSDCDFEIAGAAVAHSIIFGGPGFEVLHPAIYAHMAIQDPEVMDFLNLPCADDIPLNLATSDTKDLIDKVSSANHLYMHNYYGRKDWLHLDWAYSIPFGGSQAGDCRVTRWSALMLGQGAWTTCDCLGVFSGEPPHECP